MNEVAYRRMYGSTGRALTVVANSRFSRMTEIGYIELMQSRHVDHHTFIVMYLFMGMSFDIRQM